MKSLSKIILVQWYLIEEAEIPVKGNTAICGPNGSGKSSILDGLQTVLLGRNRRRMCLNAGATSAHKGHNPRSVYEYCLGVTGSPSDKGNYFRDQSHTYLAMVFHDDETDAHTTIGMSMSASTSMTEERVNGRFVVPGMDATLNDFVQSTKQGRQPIIWDEVKTAIDRQYPSARHYPNHAEKFVKDVLQQLDKDPRYPVINHSQFINNLKNAIAFVPISDPTTFVREFVLPEEEASLKDLRLARNRYLEVRDKILQVKDRIASHESIIGQCEKHFSAIKEEKIFTYANLLSKRDKVTITENELIGEIEDLELELEELRQRQEGTDSDLQKASDDLAQLKAERNNSSVQQRIERLSQSLQEKKKALEVADNYLKSLRRSLARLVSIEDIMELVPPDMIGVFKQATGLTKVDPFSEAWWPQDAAFVDKAVHDLRQKIYGTEKVREQAHIESAMVLKEMRKDLEQLRSQIQKLEGGQAVIGHETEDMVQQLKHQGIEATPLCDLCQIQEEQWRKTAEGILGIKRTALFVAPEHCQNAVRFLRSNKKKYRSVHIVDTTKTHRWINKAQPGSLSEVFNCENDDVQAYINRQLGSIIMVESENDLVQQDRAATADGMINTSNTISTIREPQTFPLIGRNAREQLLENLKEEFSDKADQFSSLQNKTDALTRINDSLKAFIGSEDQEQISAVEQKNIRESLHEETSALNLEIAELRKHEDVALDNRIEALEKKRDELKEVEKDLRNNSVGKEREKAIKENDLKQATEEVKEIGNEISAYESNAEIDISHAVDRYNRLLDAHNEDYVLMMAECARKIGLARNRAGDSKLQVERLLSTHLSRFSEYENKQDLAQDEIPTVTEIYEHCTRIRQELEETSLAKYAHDSEKALEEAQNTFRSKFIYKLQEQLHNVKVQISELNRTLKTIPFHNEVYSFKAKPAPEFKKIISLLDDIAKDSYLQIDGLFNPVQSEDDPHHEAMQEINTALQDDEASTRLEDYRSYYTFNLVMQTADGQEKADLAGRVHKGSGGEGQTPYYVAIGAAMASTYGIKATDNSPKGGMHLIMFDEAFSKLDVDNCGNCLDFLNQIHLQVLMGVPDEKYAIISEYMDTIINVYREGTNVEITCEYPSAMGRALLRQDNPTIDRSAVNE